MQIEVARSSTAKTKSGLICPLSEVLERENPTIACAKCHAEGDDNWISDSGWVVTRSKCKSKYIVEKDFTKNRRDHLGSFKAPKTPQIGKF